MPQKLPMVREEQQSGWDVQLLAALQARDTATVSALTEEMHAADLADLFLDVEEPEQIVLLEALSDEQAALLLGELEPEEQVETLDLLSVERASDILEEMSSDDAADLLGELPSGEADALLEHMEPEAAEDIAELLRYPEDTAGGLMAKEYVQVGPDDRVDEVLVMLRRHHNDAEMIYDLFVLDEEERLLGLVTLRDLIVCAPEQTMADIMTRDIPHVTTDTPQDEVAELVRRRDLLAVPVLDEAGHLQGIVTVDDIGDVVQEEAADDLLEMGGSEERAEDHRVAPERQGWRSGLLALGGGLLAAGLVWAFAVPLRHELLTAALLPLVLVLGVTVGSQAAAAVDRAYESAVERHQVGRIFLRELGAGALLALVSGLLAGGLVLLLRRQPGLGLGLAGATALGVWAAAVVGALIALLLFRDRARPGAWQVLVALLTLLAAAGVYLPLALRLNTP